MVACYSVFTHCENQYPENQLVISEIDVSRSIRVGFERKLEFILLKSKGNFIIEQKPSVL